MHVLSVPLHYILTRELLAAQVTSPLSRTMHGIYMPMQLVRTFEGGFPADFTDEPLRGWLCRIGICVCPALMIDL